MVNERTCESWRDFKDVLAKDLYQQKPPRADQFLFRGQRDAEWGLTSSFDRVFRKAGYERRTELYQALLTHFSKLSEIDSSLRDIREDQPRLIAKAQHHGLPTRLLDWSESPYVAAFFAFQDAIQTLMHGVSVESLTDRPVAIYALNREHGIWSSDQGVELFSVSGEKNIRLIRQGGHFTLSRTPFAKLEEWIESCGVDDALRRFLVPFQEARQALADLRLMGITHASLFGDEPDAWAREALSRLVLDTL